MGKHPKISGILQLLTLSYCFRTTTSLNPIFPQLFIPWKPAAVADSRGALPDFGLGRYYDVPPYIRLQGGIEVKKATQSMIKLSPPSIIAASEDEDIKNTSSTLHVCQF